MASLDTAALSRPVSEAEPCGPDLDAADDPDFAQFVARSDGVLPASFFTRDNEGRQQVFDRASIDFAAEFKAITPLLEATRDLRLLTIYGRLLALNRDLGGFVASLDAAAILIRDRWEEVHPRGDGGDYGLRGAVLQGFDDNPTVVLPLQYLPLVESRRSGQISYRSVMVATGEATARPGETALDRATIDRAFEEADLDALKATSAHLHKILDAASLIQATSLEKAGYEQAVTFEKLPVLVEKMAGVIDGVIAARDPSAAQPQLGEPDADPTAEGQSSAPAGSTVMKASAVPTGRIKTLGDVREALAALTRYFGGTEPSNPAGILIQQAQQLLGKPFPEVVRFLVPTMADDVRIKLGTDKLFGLAFSQLPDVSEAWAAFQGEGGSAAAGLETADAAGSEAASAAAAPPIRARTRADAAALLDQIGAFFKLVEPSSPIPLFTDRARGLLERDFLTILKDVLPAIVPKTD